jgi:hypothetical protein
LEATGDYTRTARRPHLDATVLVSDIRYSSFSASSEAEGSSVDAATRSSGNELSSGRTY